MLEIDQRPNGVYNVEGDQNESSSGPFFMGGRLSRLSIPGSQSISRRDGYKE